MAVDEEICVVVPNVVPMHRSHDIQQKENVPPISRSFIKRKHSKLPTPLVDELPLSLPLLVIHDAV